MAQWRVKLDTPYSFCTERGHLKTQHCHDFAPHAGGFNNTWRCPVTGVVMLRPGFLNQNWFEDLVPLDQWVHQHDYWQTVKRLTNGGLMTTLKPTGSLETALAIDVLIDLVKIQEDLDNQDTLVWALQSTFAIGADEGFGMHYSGLTDEFHRKQNWFAVQWANLQVHFSHTGLVQVYQHGDASNLSSGVLNLVDEFEIGSPSEFLNKHGYFIFLPIPGYGLAFYHFQIAQKSTFLTSSVQAGPTRGHLIPWKYRTLPDGTIRLFESSLVTLAFNPYQEHLHGFQRLTFPTAGTYTDGIYDPGYRPSRVADEVDPGVLYTPQQNITAALRKPDDSDAWTVGADKAYCVRFGLSTTDNRYTPFLYAWTVTWLPQFATRASTPLTLKTLGGSNVVGETMTPPDYLTHLQWSQNEERRYEGVAEMLLSSAAGRKLAKRGDSTFLLEYSEDGGATWTTLFGGFAKKWKLKISWDATGFYYRCHVTLCDMYERFAETHLIADAAFDGLNVGDAVNATLSCAQQPQLASIPPEAQKVTLPAATGGKPFQFKPRVGDRGDKVLESLLMFLHTQGVEWRIRHDWPSSTWILEKKPHDTSPTALWKLTPKKNDQNAATRTWAYGQDGDWEPEPPEANLITVIAQSTSDSTASRIFSDAFPNRDSLNNPDSIDYLGRTCAAFIPVDVVSTAPEANKMVRRFADAAAHHRDRVTLPIPDLQMALVPNTHVQLLDDLGNVEIDGWIKTRDVVVEMNDHETMTLSLDSVWERERGG